MIIMNTIKGKGCTFAEGKVESHNMPVTMEMADQAIAAWTREENRNGKQGNARVYAETLIRLGADNKDIVVVEADLMKATGTGPFAKAYPDRASM
jgi:deoxyxylulose-5-phosphate synthase